MDSGLKYPFFHSIFFFFNSSIGYTAMLADCIKGYNLA